METILATGADMKNRFLFAQGARLWPGPELGDLSDVRHYEKFKKSVLSRLAKAQPSIIACDLHPGYFSTIFARELAQRGRACRLVPVQHHHAHIASVLAESGLDKPVVGVAFDGTGLGTDGRIWGGEFLHVDACGFARLAHLKTMKMPGAEKAVAEPWRMLLSILGKDALPYLKRIKKQDKDIVMQMLARGINAPLTSSAGRVFDAAAALLGVCLYASYEAQGPLRLEKLCQQGVDQSYGFKTTKDADGLVIDPAPVFLGMSADMKKGVRVPVIASKFHNAMADIVVKTVARLSEDTGIKNIVLSGGVFQNKVLKSRVMDKLNDLRFRVLTNERLPANDLNIAWGQTYVSGCSGKN